jgi:oligoendopeptidase F
MTRERSEIDKQYKWHVDSIYGSEDQWQKELQEVREKSEELEKFRGELSDPQNLAEFLEFYSDLMRRVSTLSRYASMKADEDKRKQKFQGMQSKASSLSSTINARASFAENEVQKA